ncbi:MAG: Arm DNA-binding domain-containing protein [Methylophilaceae bacterium]
MPLTHTAIKALKPKQNTYSVADGGGLSLYIKPTGAKWWRFRYRFNGVAKMLSLGVYPDISLQQVRERRDQAKKI